MFAFVLISEFSQTWGFMSSFGKKDSLEVLRRVENVDRLYRVKIMRLLEYSID